MEDDFDDEDDVDCDTGEETSTVVCPNCRRAVYEDVEQCPLCGHYISDEDRAGHKPLWIIIGFVLCFVVVIYWLII
jgi:hypothetical protein